MYRKPAHTNHHLMFEPGLIEYVMMTRNTELKPINFNMCSNPLDVLFLIFSLCNPIQRNQPEEGKKHETSNVTLCVRN